jgi:hypothetical protein
MKEVREQFQVTNTNKFAAVGNVEDRGDINREWGAIREKIKISTKEGLSYCESKKLKKWFDY